MSGKKPCLALAAQQARFQSATLQKVQIARRCDDEQRSNARKGHEPFNLHSHDGSWVCVWVAGASDPILPNNYHSQAACRAPPCQVLKPIGPFASTATEPVLRRVSSPVLPRAALGTATIFRLHVPRNRMGVNLMNRCRSFPSPRRLNITREVSPIGSQGSVGSERLQPTPQCHWPRLAIPFSTR